MSWVNQVTYNHVFHGILLVVKSEGLIIHTLEIQQRKTSIIGFRAGIKHLNL